MFTFPLGFFQKLLQQIISGGDQYFYSIKLLLHGNNSNNSTVITDSSYSGLTATKTGNPIISTTQSKFDGSSIYFGGSSALIYKSTAFNVGSKDCTIELFFNPSVINPDLSVLFEMRPDNTNGAYVQLNFNSTAFTIYFNTVAAITAPVSIAVNTWYYVAVKKVGNLTQLWFQGSKVGEFTSGDWSSSGRIKLGENAFYYPGSNFNGYIDDFRFTLGVARDVSVVSTTPFSDTGTTPAPTDPYFNNVPLLLHGNNSDNSTVITNSGSSSYSVSISNPNNLVVNSSTTGQFNNSLFFSSSGTSLNCVSPSFNVGSQDCTIELFLNVTTTILIWDMRPNNGNGAYPALYLLSGRLTLYFNSSDAIVSTLYITPNVWYYIAVKKIGTVTQLWVDGVKLGEFTSGDWASSERIKLGENSSVAGGTNLNGYIDDFRFTLGVARDVSIIPTVPFPDTGVAPTPTTNVSLYAYVNKILSYDPYLYWRFLETSGTNLVDSSINNRSGTYSNTTLNQSGSLSTASTSILFNGTSSLIYANASSTQVSPQTIICRIKTTKATQGIWEFRDTQNTSGSSFTPALVMNSGKLLLYGYPGSGIPSTLSYNDNNWHSVATVCDGTTISLYVDGNLISSVGANCLQAFTGFFSLGYSKSNGGFFDGNIAEFSIFNSILTATNILDIHNLVAGTAPTPTPELTTDPYFANVVNLLHFNGTNGSNTFVDEKGSTPVVNGTPTISTAISKYGGASGLFSRATSDYIALPQINFGTRDFTIELWVYPTAALDGTTGILGQNELYLSMFGTTLSFWQNNGFVYSFGTNPPLNTWTHLAVSRNNGVLKLFVNGIVGNTQNDATNLSLTGTFNIGKTGNGQYQQYWTGNIDDVRITVGTGRYTANFTPPTTQFPDAGTPGTAPTAQKLIGTPFGTAPYQFGSEFDKAFDGNTTTYFNSSISSGGYCGIDLGVANTNKITKVRIYPLSGFEGRSSGAIIQGSNTIDSGYVDLFTFGTTSTNTWYEGVITTSTAYRYLRYFGASGQNCTIAEVEFYAAVSTTTNVSLTYSSNGDTNGLFYYLGTNKNTVAWSNPSGNKITIAASSVSLGSVGLLTDRNPSEFYTSSTANSWVEFNIYPTKLMCSGYSLRNRSSADHYLRNWQLQGSIDNGVTWSILDNQVNNTTLNTPSQWLYLPVTSSVAYSKFRIYETGLNSSNAYYICLGEVELYGSVPAPTTTPTPKLTTDPYLSNVILYLKGDGVDSSTNIIDSSPLVKSITLFGNAKISTTQFKTGSSSIYFDGNGDYLSFDGNLSSQQLTIETYIYPTSQLPEIFSTADASNNIQNNNLLLGAYSGNWGLSKWGSGLPINYGNNLFVLNNWNHVAFTRDANNICRLFINGIKQGVDVVIADTFNSPKILIGYNASYQYPTFFQGYLDSYRITANVARYTANFNPLTDTYLDS